MPADGLALAVLVSGEEEFVGVLESLLQLSDGRLLGIVHDIDRLKLIIDVHGELRPRLLTIGLGQLRGLGGEVADMADRGQDRVVGAEVARDLLGLSR